MHALYVVIPVLGILAIAYRFYSAFIAARIMVLDDSRPTPIRYSLFAIRCSLRGFLHPATRFLNPSRQ
jgi:hypothetical protein